MNVIGLPAPETERYVDRTELATLMGVSTRTVDRLVAEGMPSVTYGRRTRNPLARRSGRNPGAPTGSQVDPEGGEGMTFTDAKREKEDDAEDAIARAAREAEASERFPLINDPQRGYRVTGTRTGRWSCAGPNTADPKVPWERAQ